ncbi:MAG: tetratricopeptide repeat protein [Candidatus Anammoxibacter sp.]
MKKILCLVFMCVITLTSELSFGIENETKSDTKVEEKYSASIQELKEKAQNGDAKAQYSLGIMCYSGQGVAQDYNEAVMWYKKAAEQGVADAQFRLGVIYTDGQGVTQDYKEAAKWYRKAAERGNATAQYRLGVAYYDGQGVAQDYKEAIKWYRKAAEQGVANARYNIGLMYEGGQGIAQDYKEATNISIYIIIIIPVWVLGIIAKIIFDRISDDKIRRKDIYNAIIGTAIFVSTIIIDIFMISRSSGFPYFLESWLSISMFLQIPTLLIGAALIIGSNYALILMLLKLIKRAFNKTAV